MKRAALRSLLQATWLHRAAGWRRFALSLTADDTDADDLVSEAVTRTLVTAPAIRDERGLNNYVLRAYPRCGSTFAKIHASLFPSKQSGAAESRRAPTRQIACSYGSRQDYAC